MHHPKVSPVPSVQRSMSHAAKDVTFLYITIIGILFKAILHMHIRFNICAVYIKITHDSFQEQY